MSLFAGAQNGNATLFGLTTTDQGSTRSFAIAQDDRTRSLRMTGQRRLRCAGIDVIFLFPVF